MSYEGMNAEELGATVCKRGFAITYNPFIDGSVEAKDFDKGFKKEQKKIFAKARQMYKHARRCSPN